MSSTTHDENNSGSEGEWELLTEAGRTNLNGEVKSNKSLDISVEEKMAVLAARGEEKDELVSFEDAEAERTEKLEQKLAAKTAEADGVYRLLDLKNQTIETLKPICKQAAELEVAHVTLKIENSDLQAKFEQLLKEKEIIREEQENALQHLSILKVHLQGLTVQIEEQKSSIEKKEQMSLRDHELLRKQHEDLEQVKALLEKKCEMVTSLGQKLHTAETQINDLSAQIELMKDDIAKREKGFQQDRLSFVQNIHSERMARDTDVSRLRNHLQQSGAETEAVSKKLNGERECVKALLVHLPESREGELENLMQEWSLDDNKQTEWICEQVSNQMILYRTAQAGLMKTNSNLLETIRSNVKAVEKYNAEKAELDRVQAREWLEARSKLEIENRMLKGAFEKLTNSHKNVNNMVSSLIEHQESLDSTFAEMRRDIETKDANIKKINEESEMWRAALASQKEKSAEQAKVLEERVESLRCQLEKAEPIPSLVGLPWMVNEMVSMSALGNDFAGHLEDMLKLALSHKDKMMRAKSRVEMVKAEKIGDAVIAVWKDVTTIGIKNIEDADKIIMKCLAENAMKE